MRIKLLSPDIASKIAAGEVVERPASVLKELLENSIDAQATQIDITIERGGIQLIEVRDNGKGVLKDDLLLALTQHATSKISSADDLACIESLGFRGEALASINSVARLMLTSKTTEQEQAWNIYDGNVHVTAHPNGTTVSMRDLFYNLPARRKFLRSERTEYQHLEETFRRIALSNFNVGFSLKSHDKLLKSLPICHDEVARMRRLVKLCGQQVMTNAIKIDAEQNGLRLWGWLGSIQQARSQEPHQYFFINRRVIRDRLINHAIRQVYQPLCHDGKMPFYCLYLELDPVALDVNVHPTKHEVRFRDARIIHAFLMQTLVEALGAIKATNTSYGHGNYINNIYTPRPSADSEIVGIFSDKVILATKQQRLLWIDASAARKEILLQEIQSNPTMVNLVTAQTTKLLPGLKYDSGFFVWCEDLGIKIEQFGQDSILIRALPAALHQVKIDLNQLLKNLHSLWLKKSTQAECYNLILEAVDYNGDLSVQQARNLLNDINKLTPQRSWREFDLEELQKIIFRN